MDTPAPLPPRVEQFCRAAARGEPLAEAARRAGYPPVAARRHAAELWVRDDVQARIGALREAEENREQAMIGSMRGKYERMLDVFWKNGKLDAASRTMAQWWRFEKDVRAQRTVTPRERERLHDEVRDDLREQMRPEIAEELRAEMREEIGAELRAQARAQAGPVQTMTNRDAGGVSASPSPATPGRSMTNHDAGGVSASPSPATPGLSMTNHDAGRVSASPKPAALGRPVSLRHELDEIEALLAATDADDAALEAALHAVHAARGDTRDDPHDDEDGRPLSALDARLREIGRTMVVRLPSSGIEDD
ncbi:hypothetical protein [Arenibaculum sp.]|jgi:hypothetical protein|uniref:hypothetical protein n=1 Tax=Arenibaculum sp. TaxID=2865862 RepID=UPI002E135D45|nr:hypothetical protein [Arenibaculum sp.]